MAKARSGYRGYVTCREFGGLRVPVPVQSLLLRDYCQRKQLLYKLHVNENIFPHSYMVLEGLLETLEGFEGIVMTSVFMLPQRAARRRAIYERIIALGVELHGALEEMIVATRSDVARVEEILRISELLPACPSSIPGPAGAGAG